MNSLLWWAESSPMIPLLWHGKVLGKMQQHFPSSRRKQELEKEQMGGTRAALGFFGLNWICVRAYGYTYICICTEQ